MATRGLLCAPRVTASHARRSRACDLVVAFATELEEAAKAVVREAFLAISRAVDDAVGAVVRLTDGGGYAARLASREREEASGRRLLRRCMSRSSLNGVLRKEANGAGREPSPGALDRLQLSVADVQSKSNNDEIANKNRKESLSNKKGSASRKAVFMLPKHPVIEMDALVTGRGCGLVDDSQLFLEFVITWVFRALRWILGVNMFFKENVLLHGKQHDEELPVSSPKLLEVQPKRPNKKTAKSAFKPLVQPLGRAHKSIGGIGGINTAADVINASGYPLEIHKVITTDGYIVTMYRIPQKNSKKAVIFVHGMLDSSICWVSNGVMGSIAFEAYNEGFDVWLADSRNAPLREHQSSSIQYGLEYWNFTVNELGGKDMTAFVKRIKDVKCHELKTLKLKQKKRNSRAQDESDHLIRVGQLQLQKDAMYIPKPDFMASQSASPNSLKLKNIKGCRSKRRGSQLQTQQRSLGCEGTWQNYHGFWKRKPGKKQKTPKQAHRSNTVNKPFNLRAVGHSLGGATLLIYIILCLVRRKNHGLDRLVLLAPAGFHAYLPRMSIFSYYLLKPIGWVLTKLLRLPGFGIQIPSQIARILAYKCRHDLRRMPALREIVHRFILLWTGGDESAWNRAVRTPHFISRFTPGISLHTGLHIVQWFHGKKFKMYDYGSKNENRIQYGVPEAPDITDEYWRINVPVDFMSGKNDGVISPSNIRMHVDAARKAGVTVSYKEFDRSHLDFASTMKEEVLQEVMKCLKIGQN